MKDTDQCSVNLAQMLSMYQGDNKPELVGHLLRAQVAAVQDLFFERLRSPASLDFAKKNIPPAMRTKSFALPKQWFLGFKRLAVGVILQYTVPYPFITDPRF